MAKEDQYERISREEGEKRVNEIIPKISDTYIMNYENEIRFIHEKEKLSLWIIGLSIGIEFFLLSKLEKQDLGTWTSIILFSIISALAAFNGMYGLLTKLKKSRLVGHYLDMITSYEYQKSDLMLQMKHEPKSRDLLMEDYINAKLHDNVLKQNYTKRKVDAKNFVIEDARNFVERSDNLPSTILVIQVILTTAFYIYLTYQ